MLKIVATISDFRAAVNVGGEVERTSEIINIPTNNIPSNLKRYLSNKGKLERESLSFSILLDEF